MNKVKILIAVLFMIAIVGCTTLGKTEVRHNDDYSGISQRISF